MIEAPKIFVTRKKVHEILRTHLIYDFILVNENSHTKRSLAGRLMDE